MTTQQVAQFAFFRQFLRWRNQWWACRTRQCSYFKHYLAYGPADLTHDGFHAAEEKCAAAQKALGDWQIAHMDDSTPEPKHLWNTAIYWEKKVRA